MCAKEARCRAAVRCGEHGEMLMVSCDRYSDAVRSGKAQRKLEHDGLEYCMVKLIRVIRQVQAC